MADLTEKQFELDGAVFGWGCPVDLKADGFRPGGSNVRSSDADLPTEDGRRFGVDLKGGETWGFSLFTSAEDEGDGWAAYRDLKRAWDANSYRRTSGAYTRLRYALGGQTRNVYGKPRRWTPGDTSQSPDGLLHIEADFELVDDQVYDDATGSLTVGLGTPEELESGVMVPFIPPFDSIPRPTDGASEIYVDSDEETRTWVSVTFSTDGGPLSNAEVQIGGWLCRLVDPVPAFNGVLVDPRPWVRSAAFVQGGGGVAINARTTRMAKMWLPPGRHPVIFSGIDPTGAATCTVSWQNARRAPR